MPWLDIHGQDDLIAELRQRLIRDRLPHALLFIGPEGVGKRKLALRFAQCLLCESSPIHDLQPCGACPGCVQVLAGTHPDLHTIQRGEDQHELPIKSIRELCAELALRPMRASRRIAIVSDADSLSEEASNAFLKTLEEPPSRSLIMLIARSADLLLPTIRSRCQILTFRELKSVDLAELLIEEKLAADPVEADALVKRSSGSLTRARLLVDESFQEVWQGLLKDLTNPRGFEPGGLARTVETHAKQGSDTAMHRERARVLLAQLAEWFGLSLRLGAGVDVDGGDPDHLSAARSLAQRLDPETVCMLIDRTMDALVQLDRRAHLGLVLEALFHSYRLQIR